MDLVSLVNARKVFFATLFLALFSASVLALNWVQTTQEDFMDGTFLNAEHWSSPGDVKLLLLPVVVYNTNSSPPISTNYVFSSRKNADTGLIEVVVSKEARQGIEAITFNETNETSYVEKEEKTPTSDFLRHYWFDGTRLFLSTAQGLLVYDFTTGTAALYNEESTPALTNSSVVHSWLDAEANELYVSTFGGGLNVLNLNNGTTRVFDTESYPALESNFVTHSWLDEEENLLYVSTWGAGLNVLNFNYYSSGSFESIEFDANKTATFTNATWLQTLPDADVTVLTMQFRARSDNESFGNWSGGYSGNGSTVFQELGLVARFLQYKAIPATFNQRLTPVFHEMVVQYYYSCNDSTPLNQCSETQPLFCTLEGVLEEKSSLCGCPPGYYKYGESCSNNCSDGTLVETCSENQPLYCTIEGELVEDPDLCGCPPGYYQKGDACSNECDDGTIVGECSEDKPFYCDSMGQLVEKSSECGCQPGYYPKEDSCSNQCDGGTFVGQCAPNKPKYCNINGNLVDRADLCGCPTGTIPENNVCVVAQPTQEPGTPDVPVQPVRSSTIFIPPEPSPSPSPSPTPEVVPQMPEELEEEPEGEGGLEEVPILVQPEQEEESAPKPLHTVRVFEEPTPPTGLVAGFAFKDLAPFLMLLGLLLFGIGAYRIWTKRSRPPGLMAYADLK